MIKQISLILVLSTIMISGLEAQKYQVKKDVLLKDKVPVAKLNGKVSPVKTDLTIENNSGDQIAVIKRNFRQYDLPGTEPIFWMRYDFPQFQKVIVTKPKYTYLGKKQFLKYEFQDFNVHFYEDGFHEAELENFEDYSEQLHADTTSILDEIAAYKEILSSGTIPKPDEYAVIFPGLPKSLDKGIAAAKVVDGVVHEREYVIIGKIVYRGPGSSSPGASLGSGVLMPSHHAMIYKYLPKSVNINGKDVRYVEAGYIDFTGVAPDLYVYQEGKYFKSSAYKVASKDLNAAKAAAKFLEKNGYL